MVFMTNSRVLFYLYSHAAELRNVVYTVMLKGNTDLSNLKFLKLNIEKSTQ